MRTLVDALRVWPTQAYARLVLLVAVLAAALCGVAVILLIVRG